MIKVLKDKRDDDLGLLVTGFAAGQAGQLADVTLMVVSKTTDIVGAVTVGESDLLSYLSEQLPHWGLQPERPTPWRHPVRELPPKGLRVVVRLTDGTVGIAKLLESIWRMDDGRFLLNNHTPDMKSLSVAAWTPL